MNEKTFTEKVVTGLFNLFCIVISIFVIIALLLKLTGHSPTIDQIIIGIGTSLFVGYGAVFKGYVDLKDKHLEEKMDLKFHAVEKQMDQRFTALEKQMEYRFSRIEKKLGIV